MHSIWLRKEANPLEKRAILIPAHAGILVRNGYPVYIEQSSVRIYSDAEYEKEGCNIVPSNSWPDAPLDAYILGIKGLPAENFPLQHSHICYAYIYENEEGSKEMLDRFRKGHGLLLDLEHVTDYRKNTLLTKSAGFWGGVCGAAISTHLWCQKKIGITPPFTIPKFYLSYDQLTTDLTTLLNKAGKPSVLIIGSYGMTGTGARDFLEKVNLTYCGWTRTETQHKGPFLEILDYDILLNCVTIKKGISVFLTKSSLANNKKLSIIGDISCDPKSSYNPLPLYEKITSFNEPTIRITNNNNPVDLMSIDHVTTLLPNESSRAMSELLLPYLCELLIANNNYKDTPWETSAAEFFKRI